MFSLFPKSGPGRLTPDQAAELLRTTPEALQAFEQAYRAQALSEPDFTRAFGASVRQTLDAASTQPDGSVPVPAAEEQIAGRVVDELLAKAKVWTFDGRAGRLMPPWPEPERKLTLADLQALPVDRRPMLTGDLARIELDAESGLHLLYLYDRYQKERSPGRKRQAYHLFRQGLDILDLDPLVYGMLGMNPNAVSHWLPQVAPVCVEQGLLRIPATTVVRVPLTLLQLSRVDYESVNPATRHIVDRFCMEAFGLDTAKDYFVKTGTYSSKFDYRNAHVTAGREVEELGEYLLFLSNQAVQMAGPLSEPAIYGVSTTNEWVVRDYIPDREGNPTIYKGLPLHTEYRVFADFDTGRVLAQAEYWDADMMLQRFGSGAKAGSVHDAHDYLIYKAHYETMHRRYLDHAEQVSAAVGRLSEGVAAKGALSGQWSVDVMQNGDEFWLIDMALAQDSAFYDRVPEALRAPSEERWLPAIPVGAGNQDSET